MTSHNADEQALKVTIYGEAFLGRGRGHGGFRDEEEAEDVLQIKEDILINLVWNVFIATSLVIFSMITLTKKRKRRRILLRPRKKCF